MNWFRCGLGVTGIAVLASATIQNVSWAARNELPHGNLKPFHSDVCTFFPDGIPLTAEQWGDCCIRHDLKYWAGGTADEKLQADLALRACVAEKGDPATAEIMFEGVRVFGEAYYPTAYRWGYGWSKMRGYSALTPDELRQVRELSPSDISKVKLWKEPALQVTIECVLHTMAGERSHPSCAPYKKP